MVCYEVVVIDNLFNPSLVPLKRAEQLASSDISFYKVDIHDKIKLLQGLRKI
jgi:hypothetical protein